MWTGRRGTGPKVTGVFDGSLLTVIDYSLPSSAKRLWVLDLARKRVLFSGKPGEGRVRVKTQFYEQRSIKDGG